MSYKEYTDPNGKKYRVLPAIWNNSSPITESFVLEHGWTVEEKDDPVPEAKDDTAFLTACALFKDVCNQIKEFIGADDFKGGFDEYNVFINSEASTNDKAQASLLASMWAGANEYAKYEGSKIGYGQPMWWYKCWEEELKAEHQEEEIEHQEEEIEHQEEIEESSSEEN